MRGAKVPPMKVSSMYGILVASLSLMLGWLLVIAAFVFAGALIAVCVAVECVRSLIFWLELTRKRVIGFLVCP